jgi:hypothetical protein
VLLISICFISYLAYILAVLKKTQRSFTFEFIIVFIELVKVI